MRNVVAQADAVIHALALPPRIALHQRCAGEERARIALRITEASVKREATDDFPTRIDVGVPGSSREFAEVEPQSRSDGQARSARTQRVLISGIERRLDGKVVLPAIPAENQRALIRVVGHRRSEPAPGKRLITKDEASRFSAVVAHRNAAVETTLGEYGRGGAYPQRRADHPQKYLFLHDFRPRYPPAIHQGCTGMSTNRPYAQAPAQVNSHPLPAPSVGG